MVISDKQIQKFKQLYKDHFGIELTTDEAREKGIALVNLVALIYKPIPKEKRNELQKHRQALFKSMVENNTLQEFITEI